MEQELNLRIVLENPPAGVVYGIQKGSGNVYETILKQNPKSGDLIFEFPIRVKIAKESAPNFLGPIAQGTPQDRFIYIDIGTAAGQHGSIWSRRLKIPLKGITLTMVEQLMADTTMILEAKVAGTAKDGGPNCATVKPFTGWHLTKRNTGK